MKYLAIVLSILLLRTANAQDQICPAEIACGFVHGNYEPPRQAFKNCLKDSSTANLQGIGGVDIVTAICKNDKSCIDYSLANAPAAEVLKGQNFLLQGAFCKRNISVNGDITFELFDPGFLKIRNQSILVGSSFIVSANNNLNMFVPSLRQGKVAMDLGPFGLDKSVACNSGSIVWIHDDGALLGCDTPVQQISTPFGKKNIDFATFYQNGMVRDIALNSDQISMHANARQFTFTLGVGFYQSGSIKYGQFFKGAELYDVCFDQYGGVFREGAGLSCWAY